MKPPSQSEDEIFLREAQRLLDEDIRKHAEFQRLWKSVKQEYKRWNKYRFNREALCRIVAWETFKAMRENRKN